MCRSAFTSRSVWPRALTSIFPCTPLAMIPVGPWERSDMTMELEFVLNCIFVVVYITQMYWNKCSLTHELIWGSVQATVVSATTQSQQQIGNNIWLSQGQQFGAQAGLLIQQLPTDPQSECSFGVNSSLGHKKIHYEAALETGMFVRLRPARYYTSGDSWRKLDPMLETLLLLLKGRKWSVACVHTYVANYQQTREGHNKIN